MIKRKFLSATSVALVVCLGPSPASAKTVRLAELSRPTKLSAYKGLTLWSAYNRETKRYRLTLSQGETRRTLAVPAARSPIDGDLGPGPDGSPVAVYSRCRTGTRGRLDCNLYMFDLDRRRETRLPGLSSTRYTEYLPTIWRRTVVFARQDLRADGVRGLQPNLYRARVGSDSAPRRVPGGTRGRYEIFDGTPRYYDGGPGPTDLDLRGTRLAYSWQLDAGRCRLSDPDEVAQGGFTPMQNELWQVVLGGKRTLIEKGCSGDALTGLTSVAVTSSGVWYSAEALLTSNPYRIRRFSGGNYFETAAPFAPSSIAVGRQLLTTRFRILADGFSTRTVVERRDLPKLAPTEPLPSSSRVGPPVGTQSR